MAEYDGYSHYRKSAWRRLRDAEELLASPTVSPHEQGASVRHLRGAIYLAGYAVECALKAYLLSREPPAQSLEQVLQRWSDGGRATPKLLSFSRELLLTLFREDLPMLKGASLIEDWVAEGEARGETRGRRELLLALLRERFGSLPDPVVARVQDADADWCTETALRVMRVNSLGELGL